MRMSNGSRYKVIFRHDCDSELSLWTPQCPVYLLAIQIFRDTITSKTYLQFKIKNICSHKIDRFTYTATIVLEDDSTQDISNTVLDVDLPAGAVTSYGPIELGSPYVERASITINTVTLDSKGEWIYDPNNSLPTTKPLELSDKLRDERAKQLNSQGVKNPSDLNYAVTEQSGYWVCSCGFPNIDTDTCLNCGADFDTLKQLENEEYLNGQADKRSEHEKELEAAKAAKTKIKKVGIIAGIAGLAAIAAVLVCFVVVPAIKNISEDIERKNIMEAVKNGEAVFVLTNKNDVTNFSYENGSLVQVQFNKDNNVATITYDNNADGIPRTIHTSYSNNNDEEALDVVVLQSDQWGQPTEIGINLDNADKNGRMTIEYYDKGHIESWTQYTLEYNGFSTVTKTNRYEYDEAGLLMHRAHQMHRHDDKKRSFLIPQDAESNSEFWYSYSYGDDGSLIGYTVTNDKGDLTNYRVECDEYGNIIYVCDSDYGGRYEYYDYTLVYDPKELLTATSNLKIFKLSFDFTYFRGGSYIYL